MSDRRRLSKRELREDPILEALQRALAYARDNMLVVATGLVVFIGVVALAVRIGGSATGADGGGGNTEADRALSEARSEFALGRLDAGTAALETVRDRHGNSSAGREATYVLANAYYQQGEFEKARQTFEDFLKKPLYDDLMKDGARLGIAACKESAGDMAGAVADYRALWENSTSAGTRLQAGLSAARLAEAQGDVPFARSIYEQIAERYPDAPEAEDARFELMTLPG
jgi:outer membrane protein assembly factor BamD (BamD/ComL family)